MGEQLAWFHRIGNGALSIDLYEVWSSIENESEVPTKCMIRKSLFDTDRFWSNNANHVWLVLPFKIMVRP